MMKFTTKIYKLQGDFFGNLNSRKGLAIRMNTSRFINHSLLNIQSFMFSNSERNLSTVDYRALHEAAKSNRKIEDFISMLPLLNRKTATQKLADILVRNINMKKNKIRNDLKMPILTQAFGAGKTVFMMNLPKLFEKYCPDDIELKESYHIYVNLKNIIQGPECVLDRLYSLIFSSFLEKYDAVTEIFPQSLHKSNIDILAQFIRRNDFFGEFKQLLKQLKVKEEKITLIEEDFKNKKYSFIIFEIDELKTAEEQKIYSKEEKEEINQKIQDNILNSNMNKDDLSKLIRLYYFWDQISSLMRRNYFELIVSGKGTSGLLGRKIPIESNSPSLVFQIILDPLTKDDIKSMINEVFAESNIIDKEVNLSDLAKEIYRLTHGHPLYVGYSIYYYYKSILNNEKTFNLETALKKDEVVRNHIKHLLDNINMFKGVFGLWKFFYDILKEKDMLKETRHKMTNNGDSYITTTELLDNLGISYSNGQELIVKPILPGIFESEFMTAITDDYEDGPIQRGIFEEKLFGESFLNFSRDLFDNNEKNIDIKRMFSFLQKFPNFKTFNKFLDKIVPLPKITNSCNTIFDEDCEITKLDTINPANYDKLLEQMQPNVLYRHRELSSGCDYAYVRRFNKDNRLFLFFQIKHASSVDLKKEYEKVFVKTNPQFEEGCFYRLIIFNSAKSEEFKFESDEAYKVFFYKEEQKEAIIISEDYDEMKNKVLIYYVNPSEVEKFKQQEKVF